MLFASALAAGASFATDRGLSALLPAPLALACAAAVGIGGYLGVALLLGLSPKELLRRGRGPEQGARARQGE